MGKLGLFHPYKWESSGGPTCNWFLFGRTFWDFITFGSREFCPQNFKQQILENTLAAIVCKNPYKTTNSVR